MNIIIKKINNQFIFYDKDIEINIEELFLNQIFVTNESLNVEWINHNKWVKKHYFRKGLMSFLNDKYLTNTVKSTRSYKEFFILNYLYKSGFSTCKPIMGWVTYKNFYYTANLITESLSSLTLKEVFETGKMKDVYWDKIGTEIYKMHSLNIYHGDLNISNIMIDTKNDIISILDFDKSYYRKIEKKDIKSNFERLKRSLIKNHFYDEVAFKNITNTYRSLVN